MRILEIDHRSHGFFEDGLRPLHLRGLKRFVVLAGPNGAGKSRLLSRLRNLHSRYTDRNGNTSVLPLLEPSVREHIFRGSTIHLSHLPAGNNQDGELTRESFGVRLESSRDPGKNWTAFAVVPFVSNELVLEDPFSISREKLLQFGESAQHPGVGHMARSTVPYIQMLQDRWREVTHQESQVDASLRRSVVNQYEQLRNVIQVAIGSDLGRTIDGAATVFDRPIAQAKLSEGQCRILLWATGIHAQSVNLRDVILTLDEPENFLHPEALLATLQRLIDANADGQIWIATHSIPLIAHLWECHSDQLSLIFMNRGEATYAGRDPERIVASLMGGETNIESLRQFIDLPAQLAVNRFAAESLLPPEAVEFAAPSDPQVQLAGRALFKADSNHLVRALDWGAGRGRLLEALAAGSGDLPSRLDYVAWDRQIDPRCADAIARVYGHEGREGRQFADRNELARRHADHSFDVCVLCNVLHEIDPMKWVEVFEPTSVIDRWLKPEGKLLVIEDYAMPKGEYAHAFGFIVLDTEALIQLFGGDQGIEVIEATGKYQGRIKAHVIPGKALRRVSAETRASALSLARVHARDKVRSIRRGTDTSFRAGQELAFWVQQFANATLAAEQFGAR